MIDAHFVLDLDLNVSAKNQPMYTLVKLAFNLKLPAPVPNYPNVVLARKFIDNVLVPSLLLNAMSAINQFLHVDVIDHNQNQSALYAIKNTVSVDAKDPTLDQFA